MAYSVAQIANQFSLDYEGDGELKITGLCGLSDNLSNHLSYVSSKNVAQEAAASKICAFVTHPDVPIEHKTNLFHEDPNFAIAKKFAILDSVLVCPIPIDTGTPVH